MLDFFSDQAPDLTPAGFIAVDPETFETSIPGVYAGGDAADRGPASIVKAAADGKRVAAAITAAFAAPNGSVGTRSAALPVLRSPAPYQPPASRTMRWRTRPATARR